MQYNKPYLKGFTLVELIIVISILAILATIAFISFKNYAWNARDANRVSTIKNIETGLELFSLKTGEYPIPDNPNIYTGWLDWKSQLNQGTIWENVSRVIQINTIPLDPKDKTHYIYSTFWKNSSYYQVWITSEANESSNSLIIKWNYRFDPSFPSLIVVENETITNSWVFSPDVCFAIDNGKNTFNECIEKKHNMILKDYDSSLIWYWDMESLTWNLLKDLSGNQNNGIFSGWMDYNTAIVDSVFSKGLQFNGESDFINIGTGEILELSKEMTLIAVIKSFTWYLSPIFTKQSTGQWLDLDSWCSEYGNYCGYLLGTGWNDYSKTMFWRVFDEYWYPDKSAVSQKEVDFLNHFTLVAYTVKENEKWYIYVNGQLYWESSENVSKISVSKNPLLIWRYWNDITPWIWYDYTNGIIDDIKIYNRALTSEEILWQAKIAWF